MASTGQQPPSGHGLATIHAGSTGCPRYALASARMKKSNDRPTMKTIDEMLNLDLLTHEEHLQISDWIARSASPEEILQMPTPLWQAVERASQVMGVNDDLLRPPSLDAGNAVFS